VAKRSHQAAVLGQFASESDIQRQLWLRGAVDLLSRKFDGVGYHVPELLRIAPGWPKGATGRKGTTDAIGQHFPPKMSKDGYHECFISPVCEGENTIVAVTAHELAHAICLGDGHGKVFRRCATAVGLTGPMRSTVPTDEFEEWVRWEVLPRLGPYPAAPIELQPPKERGRSLKCSCEVCGYTVRTTQKWLDAAGPPICPTCNLVMVAASTLGGASGVIGSPVECREATTLSGCFGAPDAHQKPQ
jgi:hypothetical protein